MIKILIKTCKTCYDPQKLKKMKVHGTKNGLKTSYATKKFPYANKERSYREYGEPLNKDQHRRKT